MPTEVWYRNPHSYIRELVECGQGNVAWDRGTLVNKRIDPLKHASLYYGKAVPYRLLLVGEQGTAEYGPESTNLASPVAVYPTWKYGEDAALLEEVVSRPVGKDVSYCSDTGVASDERPVLGQEHRVVIIEPPNAVTGMGRGFLRYLKELQESYPDCIIHVHGLYGWQVAFGMGFRAADVEPRTGAQKGKVTVPAGREMKFEEVAKHPEWCRVLGFKPVDLEIPRNRCMYNIKSAAWAGQNYEELNKFRSVASKDPVDSESSDNDYTPAVTSSYKKAGTKFVAGDKMVCNTCSLSLDCKYFREGAVCSVPGAEPTPLARFFRTRDSGLIIDGLQTIMATQIRRAEKGMQAEDDFDEIDPQVTKMLNGLFDQGIKLAKLVDPSLRGGQTKVGVIVNGGSAEVMSGDPREFVGQVVRELESRGIPRDKITPALVQSTLEAMVDKDRANRAIEGHVIAYADDNNKEESA